MSPLDPTILVISGRAATRDLAAAVARDLGHPVVVVEDVTEVTAALLPVSAVVVDLLGTGSAASTVEALRAELGPGPPIVALVELFRGREEPGSARDAWAREIAVFLPRPVLPEELAGALRAVLPAAASPEPRRPRLLLADDDAINLRLMTRLLELQGYEVHTATNGVEALQLALELRPDAIVSDILMPVRDGFVLCTDVRTHPATATIPVLLVSANFVEEADRALAEKAGATAFLVRTPRLTEVIEALQRILASPAAPVAVPQREAVEADLVLRMRHQIEVQATMNMDLARRTSLAAAELSVLIQLAEGLAERGDIRKLLGQALSTVVELGDLAFALVYLADEHGEPRQHAMAGDLFDALRELPPAETFQPWFLAASEASGTVAIPEDIPEDAAAPLLRRLRAGSLLVAPFRLRDVIHGGLVLGADRQDLSTPDHRRFARLLGAHVALAFGLHQVARRGGARGERGGPSPERIKDDLCSLGEVLAALPTGDPEVLALTTALASPAPTLLDLAALAGASAAGTRDAPLVHACPTALTAALGVLGLLSTAGSRPTVLRGAGGAVLRAAADPADASPAARRIAVDIIRRHGGSVTARMDVGGRARPVLRLPLATETGDSSLSTLD